MRTGRPRLLTDDLVGRFFLRFAGPLATPSRSLCMTVPGRRGIAGQAVAEPRLSA
jgi:hypothetical protein